MSNLKSSITPSSSTPNRVLSSRFSGSSYIPPHSANATPSAFPRFDEASPQRPVHMTSSTSSHIDSASPQQPIEKKMVIWHPQSGLIVSSSMTTVQAPVPISNAAPGHESEVDALDAPRTETFDFDSFLQDRFGYDLFSPRNWTSGTTLKQDNNLGKSKHPNNAKESALTFSKALMSLSFKTVPTYPGSEEAIVHLVNILSNPSSTLEQLPASFDHSSNCRAPLSLASKTLEIEVVTSGENVFYLVHKRGWVDKVSWMIATSDPSTVLLIFRKQWPTVDVIARELVRRGTPFNTVKAVTILPLLSPQPVRTLGSRPRAYKPTSEDYEEYLRIRDDLLRGPKGRAALLHGGIIARIARDVLEASVVLDGPLLGDYVVGEYSQFTLVDDKLTQADKNVICGVYIVQTKYAPKGNEFVNGATSELSWWPKDSTWKSMNCYVSMEWTELAEEFYQKRLSKFRDGDLMTKNASEWRQSLRKANTVTKALEAGVKHFQGGYLQHYNHEFFSDRNY